jgi:uncharacterized Zn-finger protein
MYSVMQHDDDASYDSDNHRRPWHSTSDIVSLRNKQSNADTIFSSASSSSSAALKFPPRVGLSRFIEHIYIDEVDDVVVPLPRSLPTPAQQQQQQRRTRPRSHTQFPSTSNNAVSQPQHQHKQSSSHLPFQSHIRHLFRPANSASTPMVQPLPRRRLTKVRPQTARPALPSVHNSMTGAMPMSRPTPNRPQSIVGRLFAHAD